MRLSGNPFVPHEQVHSPEPEPEPEPEPLLTSENNSIGPWLTDDNASNTINQYEIQKIYSGFRFRIFRIYS